MRATETLRGLAHRPRGLPSACVPALWGAYNAVWLLILGAMGAREVDLYLYGGAVALIELFAGWVVLWGRIFPLQEQGTNPVPLRGDAAVLVAAAVLFGGLAAAFGTWFLPIVGATIVLLLVVLRGRRGYRSHHRAVRRLG